MRNVYFRLQIMSKLSSYNSNQQGNNNYLKIIKFIKAYYSKQKLNQIYTNYNIRSNLIIFLKIKMMPSAYYIYNNIYTYNLKDLM